ncbi:MAG: zinc ribbon domain-containing protein [bacterium]
MRCWQCGAQLTSDERYCPECYADLEGAGETDAADGLARCPECGAACPGDDSTCPACGRPLDGTEIPPDEDDEV